MGETSPVKLSDTITATPKITAPMAIQVAVDGVSRNKTTPISAAISGTPACIKRMLATVVC